MEEQPSERQALLDEAEALYGEGRLQEAETAYGRIVERFPAWNYAEHALMMIGICRENRGDLDGAEASLEEAVRRYPDLRGWSESTWYYLGEVYRQRGKMDRARHAFEKCLTLGEGLHDAHAFPLRAAREALARM